VISKRTCAALAVAKNKLGLSCTDVNYIATMLQFPTQQGLSTRMREDDTERDIVDTVV